MLAPNSSVGESTGSLSLPVVRARFEPLRRSPFAPGWDCLRSVAAAALTLAGTGHFASFHGTRKGAKYRLVRPPLAVSPLIELEIRGKNERVACRETKRLIYKLKVIGQPVTSEVRSSVEKWRKPWSPITLLLMELEQNFNVQRVPCDE